MCNSALPPILRLLPGIALAASSLAAQGAQPTPNAPRVAGRVVDASGKPVAAARVAPYWSFDAKGAKDLGGLGTDSAGRFAGNIRAYRERFALLALNEDRDLGAVVELSKKNPLDPIEIVLQPTLRLHGTIVSKTLGRLPPWTNVMIQSTVSRHRLGACMSKDASFDFRLPPGEYQVYAYGTDIKRHVASYTLTAAGGDLDLGAIDIPATFLALQRGKELPRWKVTESRGVAIENAQIADYRGKWLLIEFWGYW